MSTTGTTLRLATLLLASTALAGCLGGGGGGGGGAGGGGGGGGGGSLTVAQHDAAFNRVSGLIPTTDMPTTGSASYSGGYKATLNQGATPIGTLLADLDMTVNFGPVGMNSNVITGEVTNVRGTVNGANVTYAGKLTTADAQSRGLVNAVTTTESAVPVVGTIRTGGLMAHFSGELDQGGTKGVAILQTGGNFVGTGAQAAQGPAGGTFWGPGGPSDYIVSGSWYAER